MSRQIEQETIDWLKLRGTARDALAAALASGDFAAVDPAPYANAPAGEHGFPVTQQLEQDLVQAYSDPDNSDLTADDTGSLLLQLNCLEAARRAQLTLRQGRGQQLAHLAEAFKQAPRYDNLLTQVFTNTAKVPGGDA